MAYSLSSFIYWKLMGGGEANLFWKMTCGAILTTDGPHFHIRGKNCFVVGGGRVCVCVSL